MRSEIDEGLSIKEDILELKEEVSRLSDLILDLVHEFKSNSDIKNKDNESREIDEILQKCFETF
jgi:hypothetical protein